MALLDIWILYSLKIIYKLDGDGLSHMGIRMHMSTIKLAMASA